MSVFNFKYLIKQRNVSLDGLVYGIDGIKTEPAKIQDLRDMPTPTDKKEFQQFLDLMTFVSPFIPNMADKAVVLLDLMKEDSMFT